MTRGAMAEKTKTVVVFESHQRTFVRRSRRTVCARAEPAEVLTVSPERPAVRVRARLRAWWRAVAPRLNRK